jgi:hypothetical protein
VEFVDEYVIISSIRLNDNCDWFYLLVLFHTSFHIRCINMNEHWFKRTYFGTRDVSSR